MANVYLPYGYIDQFDGVSLSHSFMFPITCRLKGPRTARVITLANGKAVNATPTVVAPIFPVDQELEVVIRGPNPGDGASVNSMLDAIAGKYGKQGALRVKIPNSGRILTAQAILDYAEIAEDGQMDDDGVINWSIIRFYFKQLELFHD